MIKPHGGVLVDRTLKDEARQTAVKEAPSLPKITLSERELADFEMLACGAMSPLEGFMTEKDYHGVVDEMRLESGVVWPIPITLSIREENISRYPKGGKAALYHPDDTLLGLLEIQDIYQVDSKREAEKVYGTPDKEHPGVAAVYDRGQYLLGGPIHLINPVPHNDFSKGRLAPAQTRALIREKEWKTVVAFQTRNPIHRAHEYLQKVALEMVDGLLIHPLMGVTKAGDIPGDVRWKCYESIIEHYYPSDRVLLSIFPAAMRYAGPREAIFHALCRKNYGCTHFIVGRDHAGVGTYYGTYDAQEIFEEFAPGEIGITPLKFEHAFFCRTCDGMASNKTCPHDAKSRVFLSGTKVREMLVAGECPPPEFSRPEVAQILVDAYRA